MSHSELERLARIRIQVTGETLERALAVLRGDATESDTTGPDPAPDLTSVSDSESDPEAAAAADAQQADASPRFPRPRRSHLRGL
ncbi:MULTISPECIES: hypothetical protein [Streptomyces]|uniref:ANTAR domain-containing protein n=1 Tax=Streptomyces yunnanensis TaxID=156453 RepID=A0ABY8AIH1_9ACTN|nr:MULTISPECIES: hypothetical protein [Streptomyces]AJC60918.1 hypothetical protein GZL_08390 [Streptomyces sp. 769]WEB44673.1 hypothetical protein MOV08_38920 [Streptomyces yunnanensis]